MKSFVRTLAVGLVGTLLVSAPSVFAQDTSIDYDHSFAFNKVKSYSYAKVESTDPLVEPRITIAVDRVLQGLSLHLVSKNPDVVISVVEADKSPEGYSHFYSGLNGYSWQRSWGTGGFSDSIAALQNIPVGTLILDMYDPATGKLVWRGTATEPPVTKERKAGDNVDKSVNSMFAKFPPKPGGQAAPNQVPAADSSSSKPVTGPS